MATCARTIDELFCTFNTSCWPRLYIRNFLLGWSVHILPHFDVFSVITKSSWRICTVMKFMAYFVYLLLPGELMSTWVIFHGYMITYIWWPTHTCQYWPKSYVPPFHDLVCIEIFMDYFVHLRLLGKLIFTLEILYDHVHAHLLTYAVHFPLFGDLLSTKELFDGIFCIHTPTNTDRYSISATSSWP